jgi:hypothetical protein
MKIATYLILALLLFGIFRTQWSVRQSASAEARAATIRLSAFAWLTIFGLGLAFVFLPQQRVLLLLPVLLLGLGGARYWRERRAQLRRESDAQDKLERMKRIH